MPSRKWQIRPEIEEEWDYLAFQHPFQDYEGLYQRGLSFFQRWHQGGAWLTSLDESSMIARTHAFGCIGVRRFAEADAVMSLLLERSDFGELEPISWNFHWATAAFLKLAIGQPFQSAEMYQKGFDLTRKPKDYAGDVVRSLHARDHLDLASPCPEVIFEVVARAHPLLPKSHRYPVRTGNESTFADLSYLTTPRHKVHL